MKLTSCRFSGSLCNWTNPQWAWRNKRKHLLRSYPCREHNTIFYQHHSKCHFSHLDSAVFNSPFISIFDPKSLYIRVGTVRSRNTGNYSCSVYEGIHKVAHCKRKIRRGKRKHTLHRKIEWESCPRPSGNFY